MNNYETSEGVKQKPTLKLAIQKLQDRLDYLNETIELSNQLKESLINPELMELPQASQAKEPKDEPITLVDMLMDISDNFQDKINVINRNIGEAVDLIG